MNPLTDWSIPLKTHLFELVSVIDEASEDAKTADDGSPHLLRLVV